MIKLNLKVFREKKGITQKEVAEKIDVRIATISDIENGKYLPTLENAIKIALALNVTVDELIQFDKIHNEYSKKFNV